MFCKYCGGIISGTTCSKCGKASVLFAHSTELENLLDKPSSTNQKTYDEGFSKGYQKGLSEGYQNGINEPKGPDIPVNDPPRRKKVNKRLIALLCGVTFIIGAISSGLIANGIGYQTGYTNGTSDGEASMAASLEAEFQVKYEEAKEAGRKEGEDKAKKDYEQKLAQLRETPTPTLSPTPSPTEDTPTPNNQILYSKEKYGGTFSEDVWRIQDRLYALGFLKGEKDKVVDGDYGNKTKKAVIKFQEENHISPANGEVDLQTYNALFPELSQTPITEHEKSPSLDDEDDDTPNAPDEIPTELTEKNQIQNMDGLLSYSFDNLFDFSSFFFPKTTPTTSPNTSK